MNPTLRCLLAGVAVSGLATVVAAQSGTTVQRLHPVPPAAFTSMGFGYGPAGTLISAKKNAPFRASVTSQQEETLGDGTTIHRENQETVMRDSAGRIYRERALSVRPHAENELSRMINIIDTVQHVQYMCATPRKVCTKMP